MLPVNCGSHADYQNFVIENLRKYYTDPDALARSTWDIIERFWYLDLLDTDVLLADKYSRFGPAPRTPSCMQRSYLLSIDFKVSSITEWAAQLKINPLFAILSGFQVGDTPGVGTFYDFMKRLWDSDDPHMSPHIHPMKTKVKKPHAKGEKAASVEKITVAALLPQLEKHLFPSTTSLTLLSLKSIEKNFWMSPWKRVLSIRIISPLPMMGLLLSLRTENAKNAYANVRKMASLTVTVTGTFLSLTVTSAGIPLATAFIMDMIYIC